MDLAEALEKSSRILEEEQLRPTVTYMYASPEWPMEMRFDAAQMKQQGYQAAGAGLMLLINRLRQERRPRTVLEDPTRYRFISTNYNLLVTIFNQVPTPERDRFISTLIHKFMGARTARMSGSQPVYPSWNSEISCLPLLAEFCVRVGYASSHLQGHRSIGATDPLA